jgi:GDP-L-fucose synthase
MVSEQCIIMNSFMKTTARIFVAGHRGLAGSAIVRHLRARGYGNLLLRSHSELDLLDRGATREFFNLERPEFVFLAAARVGGVLANRDFPAQFIAENLDIQNNVLQSALDTGVKRLLFLGSSCIYPKFAPQPLKEEYLLSGPLEPTNRPYAIAKIAGIEMCWAFNRQYGTHYIAAMPTNLYGPNDNYDLAGSHVLPALLRKMHEAKEHGAEEVQVWGTGSVRREFLHADDMADACVFLMNLSDHSYGSIVHSESDAPLINIGYGEDLTVRDLAELIREIVGFEGRLTFDTSKPDGTLRKLLEVSRMKELGWQASIPLREGIEAVYREYSAFNAVEQKQSNHSARRVPPVVQ